MEYSLTYFQTSALRFAGAVNYGKFFCHYVPVVKQGKLDYRPAQNGMINSTLKWEINAI